MLLKRLHFLLAILLCTLACQSQITGGETIAAPTLTYTAIPLPTNPNENLSTDIAKSRPPVITPSGTFAPTQTPVPVINYPSPDYYVSPDGDNNSPGTINAPWRTIQHAANKARAGEVVAIRGGTYYEMVQFNTYSGSPENPIIFHAYKDESVTISGVDWAGIQIVGVNWIILDGIKVTRAIYDGIFISNANNNQVLNCESFKNGGVGIHILSTFGPANNNTVRNCQVHDNKEEGIYLDVKGTNLVSVDNNTIENNTIYNNRYEAIQNTNQNKIDPRPNGTIIRGNTIYDNGPDWATIDLSGLNLVVENNIVFNTKAPAGGIWYNYGGGSVIAGNKIYNETIKHNEGDGIALRNVSNTLVHDNWIYGKTGVSGLGISLWEVGENVIVKDNYVSAGEEFLAELQGDSNTCALLKHWIKCRW